MDGVTPATPQGSPAPAAPGVQPPAPARTQTQQPGGPAQPVVVATGAESKPPGPLSFGQRMEQRVADQGLEFGLTDGGRVTVQQSEVFEGHNLDDLERIASGAQPTGKPDGQGDGQQQPRQGDKEDGRHSNVRPASAPLGGAAPPDPIKAQLDKLTEAMALLLEEKKTGQPAAAAAAPVHTPTAKETVRAAMAKKLEDSGFEPELANILEEFVGAREREIREQLARDFNLPTLSLQSDLVRLYNQYGDDFKATLPAIELIRQNDPSISIEAAYKGVKAIGQALGHAAPANGAGSGAPSTSEPPAQPRVLTQEEAKALLAKRDLMRTQSGVNGTEARPSTASKKSFGEMLHQNLSTARRAGRAGG